MRQRLFIGVLLLLIGVPVAAAEITFGRVAVTYGEDGNILLDAAVRYELSPAASEALENGVPLTFETHVQLRRVHAWLWEHDLVDQRLRQTLRYRPLARLYEVRYLGSDLKQSFATRTAALQALGSIKALALIQRASLSPGEEYLVRLQVGLDIEALPLPLRPRAYLSDDWDIESSVWEWPLKP